MDAARIKELAAKAKPIPMARALPPVEGMVLHLDADFAAYNCAGNDDTCPGRARRNVLDKIADLRAVTGAVRVVAHLTAPASHKAHRYICATVKPYQGQRKGGRRPINWQHLRDYLTYYEGDAFTPKVWLTREADDGIAYVAHHAATHGHLHAIATADKDMRMLPGRHVCWQSREIIDVPLGTYELIGPGDKVYGHKWFWLQMLQGDPADNIPGIPRLGEKTAAVLLAGTSNNDEAYEVVINQYVLKYPTDWADRFVEQASLLWLCTDRHASINNLLSVMPMADDAVRAAVAMLQQRVDNELLEAEEWLKKTGE